MNRAISRTIGALEKWKIASPEGNWESIEDTTWHSKLWKSVGSENNDWKESVIISKLKEDTHFKDSHNFSKSILSILGDILLYCQVFGQMLKY